MKKILLSMALVAGFAGYANADSVQIVITDAAKSETIVGTHVDANPEADPVVYEQWNPLTSFEYEGFAFTFSTNEATAAPAMYDSKNGSWTLRLYKGKVTEGVTGKGNTMTIAAPADSRIEKIVFNNSDNKGKVTVDNGTAESIDKTIVWEGSEQSMTFEVIANFRINSIDIEYVKDEVVTTREFSTLAALNAAGLQPGEAFTFTGNVTINGIGVPQDGYSEFSETYAFVQDATGVAQLRVAADASYKAGDVIGGFEGKYIPFIYEEVDPETYDDVEVAVPAYELTTFPTATEGKAYDPEEVEVIGRSQQAHYVKAANQQIIDWGGVYGITLPDDEAWPVYSLGDSVDMARTFPETEYWMDALTQFDVEGFVGGDTTFGRAFYLTKATPLQTEYEVYLEEGSATFEQSTSVVLACDAPQSDDFPTMIMWRIAGEEQGEEMGTRAEEGFEQYDGEPIIITESCTMEVYAHTLGYLPGDVQTFVFTKDSNVGINGIAADSSVKVYNLQGVEVSADNLPAGLYIINGKKVNIRK